MAGACGKALRRVAARTGEEQRPGIRARWFGPALSALMDSEIQIYWGGLDQQIQEGLQSGAVGVRGIVLDSGEKHCRLIETLKAMGWL